jgi:peptidoglycan hydrolase CwlO-like protein
VTGPKTHARGLRRTLVAAVALTVTAALVAAPAGADLQGRLEFQSKRERQLRSGIAADHRAAESFQGRVVDLRRRLRALQEIVDREQSQLRALQGRLRDTRARLIRLRLRSEEAQRVLARQVVAQYESDQPSIVSVLLDAHGFADLLERVDAARTVAKANAEVTEAVRTARAETARETVELADLEARRARQTASVLAQRNEVAHLHLEVANRQLAFILAGDAKRARLDAVQARRRALQHQIAQLAARQAAALAIAQGQLSANVRIPTEIPGFAAHGGGDGFFQAPGTNYSVGDEPTLAARLDALGRALHVHLIGLSGYRTPQHSVEVGGFPNDPHTRGQASDTPGVEGISEATLNSFGLTRPFAGVAELDHIQLVGSV